MVTLLPLMVQSAVPGGLGRLLLSSFCCCGWARAEATIGCAKTKAVSMMIVRAIATEKCLPVMMNVLSEKGSIIAQRAALRPAKGRAYPLSARRRQIGR